MKNELILSWYGSHNAAAAMYYDGKYYVVEVERWLNSKNAGLCNYMPVRNMQLVYDEITDWLLSQTDRNDVDVYLTGYINDMYIKPKFKYKKLVGIDHHTAHAACTLFQSPYKEALIVTFDGGGDGSYFNIYSGSKTKGFELIDKNQYDLGFAYMILSDYLTDIKRESLTIGNLVYAGKLMGLCSYGKVREEWMPAFDKFYDSFIYSGSSYIGGAETRHDAVTTLMKEIGIENFDYENTRFDGQLSWDIAACTQLAFENKFYKHVGPWLEKYPDMPVCLAGGCALNVLLNTRLAKERNGKVFIPPNTSDCGIAAGQLLAYQAPENQVDLTYSGLPIMDQNQLGYYLEDRAYSTIENVSLEDLATYITQGFIVGFIQGNSEHGSRALGNRSILCNPGIKNMKDILNEKVKHREWYRPFAPISRMEDVSKYFDFYGEDSRHMTFVADVKPEWREKLPAITHEDGTGRLQTVTRWQNEAIYDLITEFEKVAGHGVILNTSFNDNGKPILTRYSDALNLLRNTQLDAVYLHEKKLIIFKSGDEKKFNKTLEEGGLSEITLDTTVNVLAFGKDEDEMITKYIPIIHKMAKKTDRLVIVSSDNYIDLLNREFTDQSNIRFQFFGKGKHYYHAKIHPKLKDHERASTYDINSTYFFAQWVRHLWVKEVVTENAFSTKYHVFVDLALMDNDYNYNPVRDLKMLMDLAKDDSDEIHVTGLKEKESIFDLEFIYKRFNKFVPQYYPVPYIFYGNVEMVTWFSNNYEAQILWFLDQNKIGDVCDYFLVSYADNFYKYKFLELEKTNIE